MSGIAHVDKWLTFPDMGHIVANYYNMLSKKLPPCRGVHGLGQPRKLGQTHPKNPKKWVG